MGIRFRCPQGHKLNVKAHQAGKKGICPHCGARFLIPLVSDESLLRERAEEKARQRASGGIEPRTHQPAAAARVEPGFSRGAGSLAGAGAPAMNSAPTMSSVPTMNSAPVMSAPVRTALDPISEAPTAVWYVRPPSGGQYGPAAGEVMRKWISEGRVSSDSLVWREGWAEWREAGPLFPNLPTAAASSSAAAAQPRFL